MKRDEYRNLVKSCNVLYVYHNTIDAIGDKEASESGTFEACIRAINELEAVVKRLSNANITNMIVTADHGFLYQNHDVSDAEWLSERPSGDAIWKESRRFVIGSNLVGKSAFTTFSAAQVGLRDMAGEGVTIQCPMPSIAFVSKGRACDTCTAGLLCRRSWCQSCTSARGGPPRKTCAK